MNSDEASKESYLYKTKEVEESYSNELETKVAELKRTKEEIKRAKESATQSWLDSRPLIDELEKLQSGLTNAKDRSSMSNTAMSELESQLETINMSIRSKKEVELEAKTTINKINLSLDQNREEMERLKLETDEERRARSKLKQDLRVKRQTLRTLQLTLRAIRIESEAFGASTEALRQINSLEMDNTTVRLPREDYNALTRRAKEEAALADRRISVSKEQRLVAKASRDSALRRLNQLYSVSRSRKRGLIEENITEDGNAIGEAEQDSNAKVRAQFNNRRTALPKAQDNLLDESNPRQQFRRSKSHKNKKLLKKRKTSILQQIKSFLVRSITRLFV